MFEIYTQVVSEPSRKGLVRERNDGDKIHAVLKNKNNFMS